MKCNIPKEFVFICDDFDCNIVPCPQEMKLQEFMYRTQLPGMRTIIEDYQSAIKYCKMIPGNAKVLLSLALTFALL